MKNALFAILLALPSMAFATNDDLIFTEGFKKGESVLDSFIGYYEMCFTGSPEAVTDKALQLMEDDIEKTEVFALWKPNANSIAIGYVDVKCLDDSSDATPDSCRAEWTVPRCSQ